MTNQTMNEEDKKRYLDRILTPVGLKDLITLLDSYLSIFNNKQIQYPTLIRFFGFPQSQFDSEGELYGRIKFISDLTMTPLNIKLVEETYENDTKKVQCYIEKVQEIKPEVISEVTSGVKE